MVLETADVVMMKEKPRRLPNFVAKVPVVTNVEDVHADVARLYVADKKAEPKGVRSALGNPLIRVETLSSGELDDNHCRSMPGP